MPSPSKNDQALTPTKKRGATMDDVLANSRTAAEVLQAVCGCVPVPAIQPIAGVLCSILKIAEDTRNNSAEFVDLIKTAGNVVRSINGCCKSICEAGKEISPMLMECIQELTITLHHIQATCELLRNRSWYTRTFERSADKKCCQRLRSQLVEASDTFQNQMMIIIGQGVEDIKEAIGIDLPLASPGLSPPPAVADEALLASLKDIKIDPNAEAADCLNIEQNFIIPQSSPVSLPRSKIEGITVGRGAKVQNFGNITTTTTTTSSVGHQATSNFQSGANRHAGRSYSNSRPSQHTSEFATANDVNDFVKTILASTAPLLKQLQNMPPQSARNQTLHNVQIVS